MAYSIVIGGEEQFPLATITGLGQLREAAYARREVAPDLYHFAHHGWSQELDSLRSDAEAVMSELEGEDDDVATILQHIIEAIDSAEGESAVLFDGMTANEVEEDWEVGEEGDEE